ncbi:MAG: hypothetical protein ACREN8_04475 [Candidatus Dormibacteraceae bacterium]
MALVTLDIVLLLPNDLRQQAVQCSKGLNLQMSAQKSPSHFCLGKPFPGRNSGFCEPHVSLFMLCVDESETPAVVDTVRRTAVQITALNAEGQEYRYNPHGAPELYFKKSKEWSALQQAIVTNVEPLRRGRLREVDPAGDRLADLIAKNPLNPHVTLAWPESSSFRVDLSGLPPANTFNGTLTEIAVSGMSPFGTCTKQYDTFWLEST